MHTLEAAAVHCSKILPSQLQSDASFGLSACTALSREKKWKESLRRQVWFDGRSWTTDGIPKSRKKPVSRRTSSNKDTATPWSAGDRIPHLT